jgi:spermidine synthase
MDRPLVSRADDPSITISEEAGVRYLHFGSEWVQGAMRIARPYQIELDYVQRMMAWLLFRQPPRSILQLGLGAATLTKFCHRQFTDCSVEAVDISPSVIAAARRWFALPADDARLAVTCGDAWEHLRAHASRGRYGVIQVDLYDRDAHGPVLDSIAFYRSVRSALEDSGIAVINLFGDRLSFGTSWRRIRAAFDDRALAMAPLPAGNAIVFAFRDPLAPVEREALKSEASTIARRYGLRTEDWVDALRPNRRLGYPVGGRWRRLQA